MNKKLLALIIAPALMAQSAIAEDQNRAISYLTSWGLVEGDAVTLEKSKIDTFLLSFGKWDAEGNIETSDGIASAPEYNAWWMPTAYITWTQLKNADPDKKMMVAFGGQTYESIWEDINTPEKREIVANGLANLLKQPFPVYKKNLKESEMIGKCLNWNWNGTQCDMTTFQNAGSVYLDGIDFDFEKAARLTEKENDDLLQLATRVRQLIGKDKLLSLTTYHVGADPVNCADSSILENCSYIENKRSTHHGEVLPLLQQSKDIFDFFNVMAYDAGPNFLWKTAMNNYGNAVGDKSKIVLGTTINSQWGPDNNFVESKENNLERARWQKQQGFGGFFTWTIGASTENLSIAQQVEYINEMKSAADEADEEDNTQDLKVNDISIGADNFTIRMPLATYQSSYLFTVLVNGVYQGEFRNGQVSSGFSLGSLWNSGKIEAKNITVPRALKQGDRVTVTLSDPQSKKVIRTLAEKVVGDDLIYVNYVSITTDYAGIPSINVSMPTSVYNGKNNIVVYVNGKYVAQSYNGTSYYATPGKISAADAGSAFTTNKIPTMKRGDLIEVRLMNGVPGANGSVIKTLYSKTW